MDGSDNGRPRVGRCRRRGAATCVRLGRVTRTDDSDAHRLGDLVGPGPGPSVRAGAGAGAGPDDCARARPERRTRFPRARARPSGPTVPDRGALGAHGGRTGPSGPGPAPRLPGILAATAPAFEAEAVLPAGSAGAGMGGGGTVLFGPEASFDTVDPAAANTNVPCDADDPMPTARYRSNPAGGADVGPWRRLAGPWFRPRQGPCVPRVRGNARCVMKGSELENLLVLQISC